MNVSVVARETSLDHIQGDQRTAEMLDAALDRPRLLWLLLLAVREYMTLQQLQRGKGEGAPSFGGVIARESFDRREAARAERIHRALDALYSAYDPGQVRGAILEALVEQQLRGRYSGSGDLCENNVQIRIDNGASHTTSTSIDVLGFDGIVGESHDCKADSGQFQPTWVAELQEEVASRGLGVGLATADFKGTAERKLSRNGIRLTRAHLVSAEFLHGQRLPLR